MHTHKRQQKDSICYVVMQPPLLTADYRAYEWSNYEQYAGGGVDVSSKTVTVNIFTISPTVLLVDVTITQRRNWVFKCMELSMCQRTKKNGSVH